MKEFDKQTLFSNIYYLWYAHHFFQCPLSGNQLLSGDLRETYKENGRMICRTLICF